MSVVEAAVSRAVRPQESKDLAHSAEGSAYHRMSVPAHRFWEGGAVRPGAANDVKNLHKLDFTLQNKSVNVIALPQCNECGCCQAIFFKKLRKYLCCVHQALAHGRAVHKNSSAI